MVTGVLGVTGEPVQKHVALVQEQEVGNVTVQDQCMEETNVVEMGHKDKPAL